jgi:hypothetical protein
MAQASLGVLAGILGAAAMVPYVRDTVRGVTRPHRGTWLIWGSLAVVVCVSQRADGASWSLLLAGAQVLLNALVILLAIRRGEGGMSPPEAVMLALAAGGVAGWIVADEPVVAIACVIAADLVAAGLMAPKTYRDPGSETLVTYAGAGLAGALAAGAVGALDLTLLLYPIYYCAVNLALALLIIHRRGVLAGEVRVYRPSSLTKPVARPGTFPISLRTSDSPARSSASPTSTGLIESWSVASPLSAAPTASTARATKPLTPLDGRPADPGSNARRGSPWRSANPSWVRLARP